MAFGRKKLVVSAYADPHAMHRMMQVKAAVTWSRENAKAAGMLRHPMSSNPSVRRHQMHLMVLDAREHLFPGSTGNRAQAAAKAWAKRKRR